MVITLDKSLQEKLYLGINLYGYGKTNGYNAVSKQEKAIKGFVDLGLNLRYAYSNSVSFYLDAYNVLDNRNQRYYLYKTRGATVILGGILTL